MDISSVRRKAKSAVNLIRMNISPSGDVYRAELGDAVWFIPENSKRTALWCMDFMDSHERFIDVLEEGDTVIEVGAATGEFTAAAADIVGPSGQIYAFEAEPRNFECLEKNMTERGLDNVDCIQRAVSNTDKESLTFGMSDSSLADHSIIESREQDLIPTKKDEYRTETVDTVTLDSYFDDVDLGAVKMLKVTVNEHEAEVLEGASKILRNTHHVSLNVPYEDAASVLSAAGFEELERRQHNSLGDPTLYA